MMPQVGLTLPLIPLLAKRHPSAPDQPHIARPDLQTRSLQTRTKTTVPALRRSLPVVATGIKVLPRGVVEAEAVVGEGKASSKLYKY